MVWDHAEANPLSESSGSWRAVDNMLEWVTKCILRQIPSFTCCSRKEGIAQQFDAQTMTVSLRDVMVSTDPPYYDNIGYADLSDFFYVWMRQSLKETYPELFSTMLVPKAEELIATPYRHDGNVEEAKEFFEDGMLSACQADVPLRAERTSR